VTIEITRTIAAPQEKVFRALTDAGELVQWFPSSADSDARTGGAFEYRFEFEDAANNHTYGGEYEDVTSNERLRFPWKGGISPTTVEYTLRATGDGTVLTLAHSGWGHGEDWDKSREMHEQGWNFFLDNLKGYVESGADLRPGGPMGQKVGAAARA
jgi:uncharacterized protein YndB with AHSA1/START domain